MKYIISATEGGRLMLFQERVAAYRDNVVNLWNTQIRPLDRRQRCSYVKSRGKYTHRWSLKSYITKKLPM